jgi:hypothetical protein
MRKFIIQLLYILFLLVTVCACSDRVDINRVYAFDLHTMPVPKKISPGTVVEIRCELVKEGNYSGAKYYIRYFQPDGKGELRLGDSILLVPNDLFLLEKDVFRLYFTSLSDEQHTIDVYIEDSFKQVIQKTFVFSNESEEKEENGEEEGLQIWSKNF